MKKHDKEFRLNVVKYYLNHKEPSRSGCAKNLGVGNSTLSKWVAEYKDSGDVRCSENFQSDEAKENAKLRKKLRDVQNSLEILKRQSTF